MAFVNVDYVPLPASEHRARQFQTGPVHAEPPAKAIPWHVVHDMVLTLTNEHEFSDAMLVATWVSTSDALKRGRQERERTDIHVMELVANWMHKLWGRGYSTYDTRYKFDSYWLEAVWRGVRCCYYDELPWNDVDTQRLQLIADAFARNQEEMRNLVINVQYMCWQKRQRVPWEFVEGRLRKTYGCRDDEVAVFEYEPGKAMALADDDLRKLSKMVLAEAESRSGIREAELAALEVAAVVLREPSLLADPVNIDCLAEQLRQQQSLKDESMNTLFDKDTLIETAEANRDAHLKLVAETQTKAEAKISAYVAEAAKELAKTGSVKNLKPLEIELATDVSKRYDAVLRTLKHVAENKVPSSDEVTFILQTVEDVTPITTRKVTVNVA